jgi:hypothetical protein
MTALLTLIESAQEFGFEVERPTVVAADGRRSVNPRFLTVQSVQSAFSPAKAGCLTFRRRRLYFRCSRETPRTTHNGGQDDERDSISQQQRQGNDPNHFR